MTAAVATTSRQPIQNRALPASQATHVEQSRAVAEVQAMVTVAQKMPRSEARALQRMAETCGMAEVAERAFFKFPRGGQTVAGPSIHLAVELARCWGNIIYGIKETDRDDAGARSEMVAYAWDMETNTRAETSFIVPHKRDKKGGGEVLIDMRDIYENNANNGARRLREMIFRVLPPWMIERAKAACVATLEGGGGEPLPTRIAKCLELFAGLGIGRDRIERKIGMSADRMTAVDLGNLAVSYQSLKRSEIDAQEEFPSVDATDLTKELKAAAPKPAEQPKAAKAPDPAAEIVPATLNGKTDWEGFAKQAIAAVKKLPSVTAINAWRDLHKTRLDTMPPSLGDKIRQAIDEQLVDPLVEDGSR